MIRFNTSSLSFTSLMLFLRSFLIPLNLKTSSSFKKPPESSAGGHEIASRSETYVLTTTLTASNSTSTKSSYHSLTSDFPEDVQLSVDDPTVIEVIPLENAEGQAGRSDPEDESLSISLPSDDVEASNVVPTQKLRERILRILTTDDEDSGSPSETTIISKQ